jgi:signal transduction histidine kinase
MAMPSPNQTATFPCNLRPRHSVAAAVATESSSPSPVAVLAADRRGEFLSMVLHELRSPLSRIVSGISFARDVDCLSHEFDWIWTPVEDAVRQVETLMADLTGVCRTAHPTFRLQVQSMDLAATVRHAARRRQSDFDRNGIRLEIYAAAGPLRVAADPERIDWVVANLLENAVKYTEPGGTVIVTLESNGRDAICRVRDTGVGIAPDALPHVFDPFVRENVVGIRSKQGSGVGLMLVRTLVELHGGHVEATSAGRGKGSEFVVRLPAENDDQGIPIR